MDQSETDHSAEPSPRSNPGLAFLAPYLAAAEDGLVTAQQLQDQDLIGIFEARVRYWRWFFTRPEGADGLT